MNFKQTRFYQRFYPLVKEFVDNGGNVDDLTTADLLYRQMKDSHVYDSNGKRLTVETKFQLLGFPRTAKFSTDVRADLIKAIEEYIAQGGTFDDVFIKSLPFYGKLDTYRRQLRRQGKDFTLDQIIRDDLGFKNFSTLVRRCKGLKKLESYRRDGFVDDYLQDEKLSSYITDLAKSLNIPYYLVVTLVADERLSKYVVTVDYVKYVQTLLEKYIALNGDLVGISNNDPKAYEAFRILINTFSDGSGQKFSKKEWLALLGFDGFENRFSDHAEETKEIDISSIMEKLKEQFGETEFGAKDIDRRQYRDIVNYARQYAISVKDVFARYGLNYKGIDLKRLNHATMTKIPYFEEMKALRDKLIEESGISLENGNSEEEVFEAKVRAVQQAYEAYEERIMSLDDENIENITGEVIV